MVKIGDNIAPKRRYHIRITKLISNAKCVGNIGVRIGNTANVKYTLIVADSFL